MLQNKKIANGSAYIFAQIKYGRYIPNDGKHFDRVLGVELVSNNQYAIRYE